MSNNKAQNEWTEVVKDAVAVAVKAAPAHPADPEVARRNAALRTLDVKNRGREILQGVDALELLAQASGQQQPVRECSPRPASLKRAGEQLIERLRELKASELAHQDHQNLKHRQCSDWLVERRGIEDRDPFGFTSGNARWRFSLGFADTDRDGFTSVTSEEDLAPCAGLIMDGVEALRVWLDCTPQHGVNNQVNIMNGCISISIMVVMSRACPALRVERGQSSRWSNRVIRPITIVTNHSMIVVILMPRTPPVEIPQGLNSALSLQCNQLNL
ncbi:hypothetical protein EJ06DRAFT_184228 [Trichodelitschia bisporula]|uniref:Uncharacterized protein n=1 Tax=Trichodelitschia bisporula TaxID=703511 RepID=A0A6G1I7G7_9PEZI|nr:hypothetical protein EJ06DRAFT_184228 [Trichodelitschia bisporula]